MSRHGTVPWRVQNAVREATRRLRTSVRAVFELERSGQAGTERDETLTAGWERRWSRRFDLRLRRHRLRGGPGLERHGLNQEGRRDAGLGNRAARRLLGCGWARARAAGHRVAARWTVAGAGATACRPGVHDRLGFLRPTDLPVRHQGRPRDEHKGNDDASTRRRDATHPGSEPTHWHGPPRSNLRLQHRVRQASPPQMARRTPFFPGVPHARPAACWAHAPSSDPGPARLSCSARPTRRASTRGVSTSACYHAPSIEPLTGA